MRLLYAVLSLGEGPGVQLWRSRVRMLLAGAGAGLIMVGCLLPHLPTWLAEDGPEVALGDLDEDGAPERLRLRRRPMGATELRLRSTNRGGHDHRVTTLQGAAGASFEGTASPWRLRAADGRVLLEARHVRQVGRPTPDLLMLAGERAWRWVYLEKGFLKLDAAELIPGFSAGLLMIGDQRRVVEAIGGKIGGDGSWRVPLATPMTLVLTFDPAGRLDRVTSRSPRLGTRDGLTVGQPAATLATRYPGARRGDTWLSPRYGLAAQLDAQGAIRGVSVQRPWQAPDARSR
ncbi:MAG: hypothetical protein VKS61_00830 [Candidatus Sericytochromatia bacterium]|nr:hypothetical protein [Candidatus Sericytochromatia bacterium]